MEFKELLAGAKDKAVSSINLLESSLSKYKVYNPEKLYTPDELEPYDALSDRFMRAVEISIKFLKTWEFANFGDKSDVLRNTLNKAEKSELITEANEWIRMRTLRNKIVHDYLPEEREETYDLIVNEYSPELLRFKSKIEKH